MIVPWATIRSAICWCLLFLILPISDVSPAAVKKHQVVSGKITMPGETAQPPATEAASADQAETTLPEPPKPAAGTKSAGALGDSSPKPQMVRQPIARPRPKKELPVQSAPSPPVTAQSAAIKPESPASAPETPAPAPVTNVAKPAVEKSPPASIPLPSLLATDRGELKGVYAYNPAGKIDPFEPLLKSKPAEVQRKAKKKRPPRIPRTPLEMVDISQLKLSAIISAASGNRALVEEASGKGYVIREGTPIGIHWGKVASIKKDRVVVEEEVQDLMGDYVKRNREMKLNKPIGE